MRKFVGAGWEREAKVGVLWNPPDDRGDCPAGLAVERQDRGQGNLGVVGARLYPLNLAAGARRIGA
jgi:hypothetical protein